MRRLARPTAALGVASIMLVLGVATATAGVPPFEVDVSSEVRCVESGAAEITWTVEVSFPTIPTSLPILEPDGRQPLGEATSIAGVRFEGVQSGAASGAVTFDPEELFVPADESSFPQSSQAVALASGTGGGSVTLDATVTIFNPSGSESASQSGQGSVDLPICEQALVDDTAEASPDTATRPRFTG